MLKITELGFCLAFPWPDPALSHLAGAVSIVMGLIVTSPGSSRLMLLYIPQILPQIVQKSPRKIVFFEEVFAQFEV
jgi:hypothetical protein